jgi:hypothetical protein
MIALAESPAMLPPHRELAGRLEMRANPGWSEGASSTGRLIEGI